MNYIYISITSNITNVSQINYHGKIIIDQRIFALVQGFVEKTGNILSWPKRKKKEIAPD